MPTMTRFSIRGAVRTTRFGVYNAAICGTTAVYGPRFWSYNESAVCGPLFGNLKIIYFSAPPAVWPTQIY